ncbi:MAG: DUF502 domain-containing protein [bacterium]
MISIKATFKQKFLAGLIITIPVVLTIIVFIWVINRIDGLLGPLFDYILGYHIYGLGFISTILIVFAIGVVSTNVFGQKLIKYFDGLLKRIPLFKGLYTSLSQIARAFSTDSHGAFKKFVIIEYPRKGIFAFGFLTKECVIKGRNDSQYCVRAVYVPTNNLYLGEIVLCNEEEVIYTDLSIEEGIKVILSGGIAIPDIVHSANS